MPVQIGVKPHNFQEPLGLLSDCHRRIEMFLGILEALGKSLDRPPSAESRRALETALLYFREAAPKHTADEEESLFPRLRGMQSGNLEKALAKMDELSGDHRRAEALHEELDHLGCTYLSRGKLNPDELAKFRDDVASLTAMYQRHIKIEDSELFPVAAEVLPEGEKLAIAKEMANRRS
ncbi:MAG TPA: hemerythrin domain-containing protein [Terriglobales bacterium]